MLPLPRRGRRCWRISCPAAVPAAAILADMDATAGSAAAAANAAADGGGTAGCSGLGCAQELFDTIGRPFSGLADSLPAASVLPGLAVNTESGGCIVLQLDDDFGSLS